MLDAVLGRLLLDIRGHHAQRAHVLLALAAVEQTLEDLGQMPLGDARFQETNCFALITLVGATRRVARARFPRRCRGYPSGRPRPPLACQCRGYPLGRPRPPLPRRCRGYPWVARARHLTQHANIIQNPERAPVRGHDQIGALELEVVNRRNRQVQLEALPARAGVEGHIQAKLRAQIQQPFPPRILAHDAAEVIAFNAVDDQLPAGAVISRLVDIGRVVVILVARGRRRRRSPGHAARARSW